MAELHNRILAALEEITKRLGIEHDMVISRVEFRDDFKVESLEADATAKFALNLDMHLPSSVKIEFPKPDELLIRGGGKLRELTLGLEAMRDVLPPAMQEAAPDTVPEPVLPQPGREDFEIGILRELSAIAEKYNVTIKAPTKRINSKGEPRTKPGNPAFTTIVTGKEASGEYVTERLGIYVRGKEKDLAAMGRFLEHGQVDNVVSGKDPTTLLSVSFKGKDIAELYGRVSQARSALTPRQVDPHGATSLGRPPSKPAPWLEPGE